jgi:hypothetical protein
VGAVLLAAGAAKAVDGRVAFNLLASELPSPVLARGVLAAVAGGEVCVGLLLLLRPGRAAALAALLLLLAMTGWILHLDLTRGMQVPCGCGLPFLGEKGWAPLLRNALLLLLCAAALRRGGRMAPGPGEEVSQ